MNPVTIDAEAQTMGPLTMTRAGAPKIGAAADILLAAQLSNAPLKPGAF